MTFLIKSAAAVMLAISVAGCSAPDPEETARRAHAAFQQKDYAEAFALYREAANAGDAGSQFGLGMMYARSEGVAQDNAQAAHWIRKAADQGYRPAQLAMGEFYQVGFGVERDAAQAMAWYQKAAKQGSYEAMYQLGLGYERGEGVEADPFISLQLITAAAASGHKDAKRLFDAKVREADERRAQVQAQEALDAADRAAATARANEADPPGDDGLAWDW